MKKRIIIFSLFFIMIFNSNVFAKTIDSKTTTDINKIWTINFNREVKSATILIYDQKGEYVPYMYETNGCQMKVMTLLGYHLGEFTIKVIDAQAKDGSRLKEPVEMNFTVIK